MNKKQRQRLKSERGKQKKGKRRPNPARAMLPQPYAYFTPPENIGVPPAKIPDLLFDKAMLGPLVDMALGMAFVQALKRTGMREAVINLLFGPPSENAPSPPIVQNEKGVRSEILR